MKLHDIQRPLVST